MHNRGHVYITLTLGKGSREDLANEPTLDACGVIRLRACVQISRKKNISYSTTKTIDPYNVNSYFWSTTNQSYVQ